MQDSYIPKASEEKFCGWISLCTVRKSADGISKIGIKKLDGTIVEDLLENVINRDIYDGKPIARTYSSGHIFINENRTEVYLLTTSKNGKIQHQFTWWSPSENINKNVIIEEFWIYKFDLEKVRDNARLRTEIRTGARVIEEYNRKPLVDWVLMENIDTDWVPFYRLVCLMHFIAKKYVGPLGFSWEEYTIDGKWYNIDELNNAPNVAPNAYIVSKNALELLDNWEQ